LLLSQLYQLLILGRSVLVFSLTAPGIHERAEIRSGQKGKTQNRGVIRLAAIIEGKIMNLSIETKVAIAVATSFIVLMVGAMASQG